MNGNYLKVGSILWAIAIGGLVVILAGGIYCSGLTAAPTTSRANLELRMRCPKDTSGN